MEDVTPASQDMSAAVTATTTSPDGRIDRDFVDLFSFLSQYHWIHDLQLTKFLESEVWNHLPSEWVTALTTMSVKELNHLPFQNSPEEFSPEVSPEISADTPPTNHHARDNSLASFLRKATNLSHHHQQQQSQRVILPPPIQIGSGLRKGMSPKKLHEVERMASLVHQVAAESGCNLVVDVGSGLGYLGQVLHKTYGLSVIGLESSQGHSDGAEKRAAKQGLHCSGMRSMPFLISQDDDNIEQFRRLIRRIAESIEPCQHSSAVPSGLPPDRHGDVSAAQRCEAEKVCHGGGDSVSPGQPCLRNSAAKLCHCGDNVSLNKLCRNHPEKLCCHGKSCQDCPEKHCRHGETVSSSQPCLHNPAEKVCHHDDVDSFGKSCQDCPEKHCRHGETVLSSQPCLPNPAEKLCDSGDFVSSKKACSDLRASHAASKTGNVGPLRSCENCLQSSLTCRTQNSRLERVSPVSPTDSVMMNNRESERSPESTKAKCHKDAVSTESPESTKPERHKDTVTESPESTKPERHKDAVSTESPESTKPERHKDAVSTESPESTKPEHHKDAVSTESPESTRPERHKDAVSTESPESTRPERHKDAVTESPESTRPERHKDAVSTESPESTKPERHKDAVTESPESTRPERHKDAVTESPESTKPERHKDAVSTEKSVNGSPKTGSQQQDQDQDEERPGNRCRREKIEEDGFDGFCEGGQRGEEGVRVCLVGLHCCGDLTPAMVRLYRAVPCLRALCCVSCCYHKMQLQTGSEELFINFPMSVAANTAYAEVCARRASSSSSSASPVSSLSSPSSSSSSSASSVSSGAFLTPCSLRLAAQETRVQWAPQTAEDHENHTRHVAYRALLELFFRNTGRAAPDRRRMRKLNYTTFDNFVRSYITAAGIQEAFDDIVLLYLTAAGIPEDEQAQTTERKLNTLYDQYKDHFKSIEPYTCLQVILQPVLERTVLRDRQRWLAEQDLTSDLLPVFDEVVSPRNLALVSVKCRPNA